MILYLEFPVFVPRRLFYGYIELLLACFFRLGESPDNRIRLRPTTCRCYNAMEITLRLNGIV